MPTLSDLASRLRALPPSPVRDALLAAVTVPCPRNKTQHAHFVGVQLRGERKPCEHCGLVGYGPGTVPRDTSGWPPGAVVGPIADAFRKGGYLVEVRYYSDGRTAFLVWSNGDGDQDDYGGEGADADALALATAAAWAEAQGAGG